MDLFRVLTHVLHLVNRPQIHLLIIIHRGPLVQQLPNKDLSVWGRAETLGILLDLPFQPAYNGVCVFMYGRELSSFCEGIRMMPDSKGRKNTLDANPGTPALQEILNGMGTAKDNLSRREFLRLAGVGAVSLGVTASGVAALAGQATEVDVW